MNEQIKKLELQAADGTVDPNGPFTAEEFNNFTKKFAELIVRECGDWIINNAGAMEHLGPSHFAKAMQKDFGVKE
jgi:hypothetical protein